MTRTGIERLGIYHSLMAYLAPCGESLTITAFGCSSLTAYGEYFVPGLKGGRELLRTKSSGPYVRLLTNSEFDGGPVKTLSS